MTSKLVVEPDRNLAIGTIIEVDGSRIVAELGAGLTELSRIYRGEVYPIGQFGSIVQIYFGRRIIYAYVARLRMKAEYQEERGLSISGSGDERLIEADLFGEGEWKPMSGKDGVELVFERGVETFPLPQQTLYITPKSDLRYIYGSVDGVSIQLGEHVGSGGAPCYAHLNELVGKHTAVLGSTGTGKSAAVAAILHSILDRGRELGRKTWRPRIVILDPHNEYSSAFKRSTRLSTEDNTLKLPYWMLSFQETVSLLIGTTEFVATSQTNIVKAALIASRRDAAGTLEIDANAITVDSPVPYCLDKFRTHINSDKPPQASKQDSHNSILQKLDVLRSDGRLKFMWANWDRAKGDEFVSVISEILDSGVPPKVVDLSGVPNEVAGVASAAIARTLFNLKVWQNEEEREANPVLLVCEEAHRYVPNRGEAQYGEAQESIRRVAKEGRKYGVGMVLVSQRPSEVESTVLSQCSTWIVLRVTNELIGVISAEFSQIRWQASPKCFLDCVDKKLYLLAKLQRFRRGLWSGNFPNVICHRQKILTSMSAGSLSLISVPI